MWPNFNLWWNLALSLHTRSDTLHQSTGALVILPNLAFCIIFFSPLQIDHFGFLEDGTFKQRYLVNDKHWQQPGGPVFFYTGNEGDITWFCNNTVNIPPCFQTICADMYKLKSVIISFAGLYVGNCGGVWCHAGFCRTPLLWRVPTIWSRLLQCKWWRIKCSYSSARIIQNNNQTFQGFANYI